MRVAAAAGEAAAMESYAMMYKRGLVSTESFEATATKYNCMRESMQSAARARYEKWRDEAVKAQFGAMNH